MWKKTFLHFHKFYLLDVEKKTFNTVTTSLRKKKNSWVYFSSLYFFFFKTKTLRRSLLTFPRLCIDHKSQVSKHIFDRIAELNWKRVRRTFSLTWQQSIINNFFLGFCGRFSFFRWIDLSFKQSRNESCDLRIVWWIEKTFGESINRSLEGIKSNSNKCFSFTKRFSVQFWFGMRKSTKSCL